MRSCYFCGESNKLVLECAHITPRCIGDKVYDKSNGSVDVELTVDLCANCHKKLERLQNPYVKFVKTAFEFDEKKQIDLTNAEVFQADIIGVSANNNRPFVTLARESFDLGTEVRLHSSIIGNALVAWSNNDTVDISVVDGLIVDIVKAKKVKSSKKPQFEAPRSLRDKLSIILGVLSELEKKTGIVNKQVLLDSLKTNYGLDYTESSRMIKQMISEGTLFEPRKDFLKIT